MRKSLFGAILLCLSHTGFANPVDNSPLSETTRRHLQDLCTLSIYMSGQYKNADSYGGSAILNLMPESENRQYRYTMSNRADTFSKIVMGEKYFEGLHQLMDFFSRMVVNEGLCEADKLYTFPGLENITPGAIQRALENPLSDKLYPSIKEKYGEISNQEGCQSTWQSERVVRDLLGKVIEGQKKFYFALSLKGPEIVDYMLEKGFKDSDKTSPIHPDNLHLDQELERLSQINGGSINPFQWQGAYLFKFIFPTTPMFWKYWVTPLNPIQDTFKQGIAHIQKGDFQEWWRKFHK